jgi:hypothetical protein
MDTWRSECKNGYYLQPDTLVHDVPFFSYPLYPSSLTQCSQTSSGEWTTCSAEADLSVDPSLVDKAYFWVFTYNPDAAGNGADVDFDDFDIGRLMA